jgi:hypothetical protein
MGFVVRTNEFLPLNEFVDNLPIELLKIFQKPLAKDFKTAMPAPQIPNPVPPIARRLALHFGSDVTSILP